MPGIGVNQRVDADTGPHRKRPPPRWRRVPRAASHRRHYRETVSVVQVGLARFRTLRERPPLGRAEHQLRTIRIFGIPHRNYRSKPDLPPELVQPIEVGIVETTPSLSEWLWHWAEGGMIRPRLALPTP